MFNSILYLWYWMGDLNTCTDEDWLTTGKKGSSEDGENEKGRMTGGHQLQSLQSKNDGEDCCQACQNKQVYLRKLWKLVVDPTGDDDEYA